MVSSTITKTSLVRKKPMCVKCALIPIMAPLQSDNVRGLKTNDSRTTGNCGEGLKADERVSVRRLSFNASVR